MNRYILLALAVAALIGGGLWFAGQGFVLGTANPGGVASVPGRSPVAVGAVEPGLGSPVADSVRRPLESSVVESDLGAAGTASMGVHLSGVVVVGDGGSADAGGASLVLWTQVPSTSGPSRVDERLAFATADSEGRFSLAKQIGGSVGNQLFLTATSSAGASATIAVDRNDADLVIRLGHGLRRVKARLILEPFPGGPLPAAVAVRGYSSRGEVRIDKNSFEFTEGVATFGLFVPDKPDVFLSFRVSADEIGTYWSQSELVPRTPDVVIEVRVSLERSEMLGGLIVDEVSGAPIGGATVRLFGIGGDVQTETYADAGGRFQMRRRTARMGQGTLLIRAEGFRPGQFNLADQPSGDLRLGMTRGARIEGVVLGARVGDAEANPMSATAAFTYNVKRIRRVDGVITEVDSPMGLTRSAPVDELGQFTLEGLPPGPVEVVVYADPDVGSFIPLTPPTTFVMEGTETQRASFDLDLGVYKLSGRIRFTGRARALVSDSMMLTVEAERLEGEERPYSRPPGERERLGRIETSTGDFWVLPLRVAGNPPSRVLLRLLMSPEAFVERVLVLDPDLRFVEIGLTLDHLQEFSPAPPEPAGFPEEDRRRQIEAVEQLRASPPVLHPTEQPQGE